MKRPSSVRDVQDRMHRLVHDLCAAAEEYELTLRQRLPVDDYFRALAFATRNHRDFARRAKRIAEDLKPLVGEDKDTNL